MTVAAHALATPLLYPVILSELRMDFMFTGIRIRTC